MGIFERKQHLAILALDVRLTEKIELEMKKVFLEVPIIKKRKKSF